MHGRNRTLVLGVVVLLILGLAVVGGRRVWDRLHRSDLDAAVAVVPRETQRLSFTDWEQVRDELGVPETASPTAAEVERLTDRGYDRDLTAVSSIDEATAALQEHFGFSPTTISWEAFAQSKAGATMVARMPDGFDFDKVRGKLRDAGFTEPRTKDGVWLGGADLVAALDPTITPELQYVAVLADRHLIVTSDNAEYARSAASVARGRAPDLGELASVRDLADRTGEPAAAMLWPRDFACTDLAMSSADQDSQDQAETLIEGAGNTSPVNGLAMALEADRRFRVVLHFESAGQAKENLRARAELAVGDAVGRGGSFSDDLRLTSSRTDGPTVVLGFRPKQRTGFVLSALDSGPVIFATC